MWRYCLKNMLGRAQGCRYRVRTQRVSRRMHTPLALQQLGATTPTRTLAVTVRYGIRLGDLKENVCVLLLQDLLQSCSRGGGGE